MLGNFIGCERKDINLDQLVLFKSRLYSSFQGSSMTFFMLKEMLLGMKTQKAAN